MRNGSGVVTSWKQAGGFLFVGGDSRIVRVWDAHTESQIMVNSTRKISLTPIADSF